MPATTVQQPWYLAERAESLAIINLTENPQIEILRRYENDAGLEILVMLREEGKPSGRYFGVEVKATVSAQSKLRDLQTFDLDTNKQPFFRDIPFPVCLMLFTVDNDQGYWGWVRQPLSDDGGHRLLFNDRIALSELTRKAVDQIVLEVRQWYDRQAGRR